MERLEKTTSGVIRSTRDYIQQPSPAPVPIADSSIIIEDEDLSPATSTSRRVNLFKIW